jgi:hypothetical protein
MRLLVCGDRNWNDRKAIYRQLDRWLAAYPNEHLVLIEGGARGADAIAGTWADDRGIEHLRFPADWKRYGRGAGPVRNRQMLNEGHPSLVFAFHNDLDASKGTRDMVECARQAGVLVRVFASSSP